MWGEKSHKTENRGRHPCLAEGVVILALLVCAATALPDRYESEDVHKLVLCGPLLRIFVRR